MNWIFGLVSFGLLVGCATSPTRLRSYGLSDALPQTGLIFHAEVLTNEPFAKDPGCLLEMKNLATDARYEFVVTEGSNTVIAEMPVGEYAPTRLDCRFRHYWELPAQSSIPIKVAAGKLNYSGGYSISSIRNNDGDYVLAFRDLGDPLKRDRFSTLHASLQGQSSRLVSSYTSLPIDPRLKARVEGDFAWHYRVTSVGNKNLDQIKDPSRALQECAQQEAKLNAIHFGEFAFKAFYNSSRFSKVDWSKSGNIFHPQFKVCIERTLREHQTQVKGSVTFDYRIGF